MIQLNWGHVQNRVKSLLNSRRQRLITVIEKSNIIKAQILPLITFVGTIVRNGSELRGGEQ
jgi:hypothetical protein